MSRPLRIEYPGAFYHVTSRGDRKEAIYEDDFDRQRFEELLGDVCATYNWGIHAYCLMGNHYHLVVETPDGNLSKGMRQLNGVYTQATNRRHNRVGHLFQGRYNAILVDAQAYLLELARYVVLNPVRAGMVELPDQWRWSSYRHMLNPAGAPAWLLTERILAHFSPDCRRAIFRYVEFVRAGIGLPTVWQHLNQQVYLGNDEFVAHMQQEMNADSEGQTEIPRIQRRAPALSLDQIATEALDRDAAIIAAYASGRYSYQEIGDYFGVHFTTVGRIVRLGRGAKC